MAHERLPNASTPITMRVFYRGRVDALRPLTAEAAAWLQAMLEADAVDADADEQLRHRSSLLALASLSHRRAVVDAMLGIGLDSQLFGLRRQARVRS